MGVALKAEHERRERVHTKSESGSPYRSRKETDGDGSPSLFSRRKPSTRRSPKIVISGPIQTSLEQGTVSPMPNGELTAISERGEGGSDGEGLESRGEVVERNIMVDDGRGREGGDGEMGGGEGEETVNGGGSDRGEIKGGKESVREEKEAGDRCGEAEEVDGVKEGRGETEEVDGADHEWVVKSDEEGPQEKEEGLSMRERAESGENLSGSTNRPSVRIGAFLESSPPASRSTFSSGTSSANHSQSNEDFVRPRRSLTYASSWSNIIEDESDEVWRTFAVVTETVGYILWHSVDYDKDCPPWKVGIKNGRKEGSKLARAWIYKFT